MKVTVPFAIAITGSMATLGYAINDGLCHLDNQTTTCLPSSLCTFKNRTETKPCNLRSHAHMLPQQIHLAYAGIPAGTGMTLSWATFDNVQDSAVWIGSSPSTLQHRTDVSVSSFTYYSEGNYSLYQHHARVTGLRPDTKYYYKVGEASDPYFTSAVSTFTTARPSSDSRPFDVIVYGDLGFGAKGDATQAYVNSFYDKDTFVLHIGDISYADDDFLSDEFSNKFGYEIVWNRWMNAFAPTMEHIPYMTCVGNHEAECHSGICGKSLYKQQHLGNYTAYNARFRMPSFESNGSENMWYSFDNGPIHISAISSETDYDGFPQNDYDYEIFGGFYKSYGNFGNQLAWLEADLKKAVANRANVPWIIVVMHRPIYQKGGVLPNGTLVDYSLPLQKAFEPLFLKYKVDLVYAGHEHEFERQTPIANGTAIRDGVSADNKTYTNPKAPVYVVTGGAGNPEPNEAVGTDVSVPWNVYQTAEYGITLMHVTRKSLTLRYVTSTDSVHTLLDEFTITKE